MANQGSVSHLISAEVGSSKTDMSNQPTYVAVLELMNTTAAAAYLQIFWKAASAVTLGTTVADVVIGLPASGGAVLEFPGEGWKTGGTAWSVAGTTTRTGNTQALISVTCWKKN